MRSHLFRVQRGLDQRWYVSHYGSMTHSFPTQVQAEEFAMRLAKANPPSMVRVEVNGEIEKEWTYGDEPPR